MGSFVHPVKSFVHGIFCPTFRLLASYIDRLILFGLCMLLTVNAFLLLVMFVVAY